MEGGEILRVSHGNGWNLRRRCQSREHGSGMEPSMNSNTSIRGGDRERAMSLEEE
jgi:hypothetical protein